MGNHDIFQRAKIRDAWYDVYGLLKKVTRAQSTGRRLRRAAAAAVFIVTSSLIGFNASVSPVAANVPAQLTLQWPTGPTPIYTKQQLADALHAIRRTGADWNGKQMTAPDPKAVTAAERILPQLPSFVAQASAGVDGDGNVYFRMAQGERVAYLTVEPRLVHLLIMEPGQQNVYVDDQPFKGKVLPHKVKEVLTAKMA